MSEESEPVYSYVKGQGWIIGRPFIEAVTLTKRKVRIEERDPRPRERYLVIDTRYENLWTNGELNVEGVRKYISNRGLQNFFTFNKSDVNYYRTQTHTKLVTIIPVKR